MVFIYGIYVQFYDLFLTFRSVTLPARLIIPRKSFLVFATSSTLYNFRGVLGNALGSGVVDGVAHALFGGVDSSYGG